MKKAMKMLKLENLTYITILFLPLYLLRIDLFAVPSNVLEILMGVAILWKILEWKKEERKIVFEKYKTEIFLFSLIILGLIVSLFLNGHYLRGFGIIKSWFVLPFVFSLLLIGGLEKEKKKNVLISLYVSIFFVAVAALFYLFLGHVTYDGRLEAFFNSPNYLAMYLAPGVIMAILVMEQAWGYSLKLKISAFISFLAILVAFYFTYSYAAWISVAIASVAIFLLNNKFSKKYLITFCLIFLVVVFLLRDTTKFHDLVSFNERSSLASRVMIWKSSGKILADYWFFGIGPGNFQDKYLEYQKYFPPYLEWAVPQPHNLYLAFWLYGGFFGILGFLALIFGWFRKSFLRKNDKLVILAIGVMIYILIHGLFDTTYFKNDLTVVFWLIFFIL
jgi:O-antigen ligase